jgi:hypothetical protein
MRLFAAILILLADQVAAQSLQVISYESLKKNQLPQKLSWINPDSTKEELQIIQMAIPIDNEMKDLTRLFMSENYGRSSIWVEPRMIVIHSMDLGDLQHSLEQSSFLDRHMPPEWTTQAKAGALPSGAQFIIDRDGKIYCLTPPNLSHDESRVSYRREDHRWMIKRHLDANPMALGIENVTPQNGSFEDLTGQQVNANAQLVRWLLWMEKGSITHLASHHQFNDSARFDSMLKEFSLKLPRPMLKAWTRKDVGEAAFRRIIDDVRKRGWPVKESF